MMKKLILSFTIVLGLLLPAGAKNLSSEALTTKAWASLDLQNWKAVEMYTNQCYSLYKKKALEQQASLTEKAPKDKASTYWALNDVSTCLFIQAKAALQRKDKKTVNKACNEVINSFSFGQCFDPRTDSFWSVADACQDLLGSQATGVDFGDYTSETMVRKAWESLGVKEYNKAVIYTQKCIELYGKDAKKMQESLTGFASKDNAFDYWALNDVGTACFIQGEAYAGMKKWVEALKAYERVFKEYSWSQCFDPSGPFFWQVAKAARGKYFKIRAQHPQSAGA